MKTKECNTCGRHLESGLFYKHKRGRFGVRGSCKECESKKDRITYNRKDVKAKRMKYQHSEKFSRKAHGYRLKEKYTITLNEYDEMYEKQNGVCAICGKPEKRRNAWGHILRLAVDHCHDTGKIRGLLCCNCNMGIGNLQHDVQVLAKAIIYLKKEFYYG